MKKNKEEERMYRKLSGLGFICRKEKKKGGDLCFEIGTLTTNLVAVVLVDGKECLLACCAKCC